jgi:prolyl-tRNA editing enzyme YbaK/EbsC (Cys-tRNA(Pro) deacylase)
MKSTDYKYNSSILISNLNSKNLKSELSPHLRIADENDSAKLTGFQHNAVSPFGLRSSIPIILAEAITKIKPNFIFLGGGLN